MEQRCLEPHLQRNTVENKNIYKIEIRRGEAVSREYKASLPLLLAAVCPVKAGVVRWMQINIAAKHELTRHGVSHSYSYSSATATQLCSAVSCELQSQAGALGGGGAGVCSV